MSDVSRPDPDPASQAERIEELRSSAIGSVEVLHGLVTGPAPDWQRVRELASLLVLLAEELAGACS